MLADLTKQGCRALILDLRWCPGGFVTEGTRIAGMFLPEGAMIAQMRYRTPRPGDRPDERAIAGPKFTSVPLVVLVGSETTGGGELIAAALQDNQRATVIGLQETRAEPEQVPMELLQPRGYDVQWTVAKKRGYSGCATFSRQR